jgi:hypothetical protein
MLDGTTKVASIEGAETRGRLEIVFARDPSGRAYLRRQYASYPYHVCRPLSFAGDPAGMATIYVQSCAGGIFRDDRLHEHIVAEEGAAAHTTGLDDRPQHGSRRRRTGVRSKRRRQLRDFARSLHPVPAVLLRQQPAHSGARCRDPLVVATFIYHDPLAPARCSGFLGDLRVEDHRVGYSRRQFPQSAQSRGPSARHHQRLPPKAACSC